MSLLDAADNKPVGKSNNDMIRISEVTWRKKQGEGLERQSEQGLWRPCWGSSEKEQLLNPAEIWMTGWWARRPRPGEVALEEPRVRTAWGQQWAVIPGQDRRTASPRLQLGKRSFSRLYGSQPPRPSGMGCANAENMQIGNSFTQIVSLHLTWSRGFGQRLWAGDHDSCLCRKVVQYQQKQKQTNKTLWIYQDNNRDMCSWRRLILLVLKIALTMVYANPLEININ